MHGLFNASAGKDKDGTSSTSQDKVDKIESDDLKASLEKNVTISTVDADKEEMVYIISDAKGDVSSVIVSEHLKNKDGKDKIKDVSSLSDIKNVKGDETFTQDGRQPYMGCKGFRKDLLSGNNRCRASLLVRQLPTILMARD